MKLDLIEIVGSRPKHRRRHADRSDHRSGVIADRRAEADDAGLKLLAVNRKAIPPRQPQFLLQLIQGHDRTGRERRQPLVGDDAIQFTGRKPGQNGLADRGGVRRIGFSAQSRVDPHHVPRIAAQDIDQAGILHDRELDGFAGLLVEPVDKTLRAPGQVDLTQAGSAEVQDARAQHIGLAAGATADIAPIAQRRNQVMTGRHVQAGRGADLGELRFATGIGNDVENQESAIERLDSALVPAHGRTGGHHPVRLIHPGQIRRHAPSPAALWRLLSDNRPI